MDVFTHFLLPYFLLMAFRRPPRERLAAGLGGYAPDLDVLTGWVGLVFPSVYWLGHRGVSHSLLGAPLYAAALMLVLALPFWRRRFPRMAVFAFSWRTLLVAMAGSSAHLALDFLTVWGVPLLYPWDASRFTINWYFYSAWSALAVGAYVCWRMLRGRADEAFLRRGAVALVAVLLVVGGLRLATRPALGEGEVAHPDAWEWQWTVLTPEGGGWRATSYSWGEPTWNATYAALPPLTPAAEAAVAAARESLAYRKFHLYAGGPEVLRVAEATDGAWSVTFIDLLRQTQADRSGGLFARFTDGTLRLTVDAEGVREAED